MLDGENCGGYGLISQASYKGWVSSEKLKLARRASLRMSTLGVSVTYAVAIRAGPTPTTSEALEGAGGTCGSLKRIIDGEINHNHLATPP